MKYYSSREASKILDVHANTLRKWADDGTIETIKTASGQRRYNLEQYAKIGKLVTVCYCRVSSAKQRDDLARQVDFMRAKYPNAEIIKDVGSGLNFKRKGLKALLERAMRGDSIELVVAHRDRLARFGQDLIKQVIEFNGGKLVVLDQSACSPEEELTKDLFNILHVFSCRMHGLRNYKKQVAQATSNPAEQDAIQPVVESEPLCL
jgi:predicted site-specific integrase-resolvase